jgi:Fe-S oxidoreductase
VAPGEDVVFLPGEAALLDAFFQRDAEYAAGPHGALLLMAAAGVRPLVVGASTGHDLFYQGRLDEFEALKERTRTALEEALERTGGGAVVCASAEDAHALRDLYKMEAVHVTEFLEGRELELRPPTTRPRVAFFDPCRLGRYRSAYDQPRELLSKVAEVVDLGYPRGEEPCCGVSAWVNCNTWSKSHREGILRRAVEAGAEALVTACPMCQVHLDCYFNEEGYDPDDPSSVPLLRVADICELVAELGGLRGPDAPRLEPPEPDTGTATGLLGPIPKSPVPRWLTDEAVRAAHLCTLCLRCVHECPQDAPVLEHVMEVRSALCSEGLTPPDVAAMVTSVDDHGNPFGEPLGKRTEAYPPELEARILGEEEGGHPEVLLFLGCVYSYQDPRALATVARVLEAAGVDYAVLGEAEGCCGYVDYLAGAGEAFEEVASARMEGFRSAGARVVVTPCSGCHRTFSQLYPGVSGDWPGEVEVLHLVEYLLRLVQEGRLPLGSAAEGTTIAYHDPCDLGRHAGVYDAPRELLGSLDGVTMVEFPDSRESAMCCGGGGGLRAFDAEVSQSIAVERLGTLPGGVDVVASACISCKGNLRQGAAGLARTGGPRPKVMDVVEVVASRLTGGESG